jgi:hypothetical protein
MTLDRGKWREVVESKQERPRRREERKVKEGVILKLAK